MSDFSKRHQELLDKKTNLFKCDDCLVKDEQINLAMESIVKLENNRKEINQLVNTITEMGRLTEYPNTQDMIEKIKDLSS